MRVRGVIWGLLSVILLGAGVALVDFFFLGQDSQNIATNSSDPESFNVPEVETTQQMADEGGPEGKTLTITKMSRVTNVTVRDTVGDDEESLKNYAAIHLRGTGFPWQKEANVYLAGHRLGYPGFPSFLAFRNLDVLESGDEVYVTDADGKEYTYRVFKEVIVNPTNLWVTEPVPRRTY